MAGLSKLVNQHAWSLARSRGWCFLERGGGSEWFPALAVTICVVGSSDSELVEWCVSKKHCGKSLRLGIEPRSRANLSEDDKPEY